MSCLSKVLSKGWSGYLLVVLTVALCGVMVDYLVHQCEGLAADLFLRLRIVADQNAVGPLFWVKSITA